MANFVHKTPSQSPSLKTDSSNLGSLFNRINNKKKSEKNTLGQDLANKETDLAFKDKFSIKKKGIKLPFVKNRLPLQAVLGLTVLLLLVVGAVSAMFLAQSSQDVRNQAKEISKTFFKGISVAPTTETSKTAFIKKTTTSNTTTTPTTTQTSKTAPAKETTKTVSSGTSTNKQTTSKTTSSSTATNKQTTQQAQPTSNTGTGGTAATTTSGGSTSCSAGEIFCGGCLGTCMPDTVTCNTHIDRECSGTNSDGSSCKGDGQFAQSANECCSGLQQCANGRCANSCTLDSNPICGGIREGSNCNNGGRWVCSGGSGSCQGGVWNQTVAETTAVETKEAAVVASGDVVCNIGGSKFISPSQKACDLSIASYEASQPVVEDKNVSIGTAISSVSSSQTTSHSVKCDLSGTVVYAQSNEGCIANGGSLHTVSSPSNSSTNLVNSSIESISLNPSSTNIANAQGIYEAYCTGARVELASQGSCNSLSRLLSSGQQPEQLIIDERGQGVSTTCYHRLSDGGCASVSTILSDGESCASHYGDLGRFASQYSNRECTPFNESSGDNIAYTEDVPVDEIDTRPSILDAFPPEEEPAPVEEKSGNPILAVINTTFNNVKDFILFNQANPILGPEAPLEQDSEPTAMGIVVKNIKNGASTVWNGVRGFFGFQNTDKQSEPVDNRPLLGPEPVDNRPLLGPESVTEEVRDTRRVCHNITYNTDGGTCTTFTRITTTNDCGPYLEGDCPDDVVTPTNQATGFPEVDSSSVFKTCYNWNSSNNDCDSHTDESWGGSFDCRSEGLYNACSYQNENQ